MMERGTQLLIVAVFAVLMLAARAALASDETIVLVTLPGQLQEQSWPQAEQRTAAELSLTGLTVQQVVGRSTDVLSELGEQGESHGAIVALCLLRRGDDGIDVGVWLQDGSPTGRKVVHRLELAVSSSREPEADVALQVVELVHSSLVELRTARTRPRKVPPVDDHPLERPAPATGRQAEPTYAIGVGPGVAWSPGKTSLAVGLAAGVSGWLGEIWRAEADVFTLGSSATAGDDRGTAQIRLTMVRMQAGIEPWRTARLSPGISLGAGVVFADASAEASNGYRSKADSCTTALVTARFSLGLRLTRAFGLRGSMGAHFTKSPLEVRFDSDTVATVGRPLLDSALQAEWRW